MTDQPKHFNALAPILLMLALFTPTAYAAGSSDESEIMRSLLDRIEKLEKRVAELEGSKGKGPAGEAALAAERPLEPKTAPAAQADPHLQRHAGVTLPDSQTYPSFKMSGFSDINFSATDQKLSRSGFSEGQFVLHVSSALSSRVAYFGELTLTTRPDAGRGNPRITGFDVEVERSIIRFDQSDFFKVSFGRYHTPINYWNTAYHHGVWLQTPIVRPVMLGQIIPVHFVGALAEGTIPASGLNLNYDFGFGNGRDSIITRAGDAGDANNNRAWLLTLFAKPDALYGLQFGGSVYRDLVTLPAGRQFREWIGTAHAVWSKETPELIAEFAHVDHREIGRSTNFGTNAFYVHSAYRLPWFERVVKPYYRFEYTDSSRTDPVFQGMPDFRGSVIGTRYDLSLFAALKAEYRHQRRSAQPNLNGAFVQVSFTF